MRRMFPVAPLQSSPPLHLPSFSCQCVSISCDRASQTQSESPNIYAQTPMCWNNLYFCRMSFGCCGRFTPAEITSFFLSFFIVCIWVLTGHWLLMDGQCNGFVISVECSVLNIFMLYRCSARHGSVRGVHRSHSTSKSQSVDAAARRSPHLRRLLGKPYSRCRFK